MMNRLSSVCRTRYCPVYLFWLLSVLFFTLERAVLLFHSHAEVNLLPGELFSLFLTGLFYDLVTATYLSIPLVLYFISLPERVHQHPWQHHFARLLFFVAIFVLLFDGVAEWLFWDEFTARFNFIAVDYLVYTHEVVGNIRESYPLPWIFSALFLVSLLTYRLAHGAISWSLRHSTGPAGRLRPGLALLALPLAAFLLVDNSHANISANRVNNELAANGIYSLFSAFRNNQLDYNAFYRTEPRGEAVARLREELREPDATLLPGDGVRRLVRGAGPEQHRNVVLITVESLSAEFLGAYGSDRGLTPNLDALAKESMVFTNLFATGTRTVRGLEAITLSLPPTPGRSIVKRPGNDHLFSPGFLFRERGYDVRFLYGGYGYFDNMNAFFSGNGFDIVDRAALDDSEIHFANIWGVSDEDLLDRTLKEADRSHAAGKPFFHLVMTTSNHRPFTYPEGRIDIPSHQGREGGVKYTDYAIGRFIRQAREKPWFHNTLFVVVADHCAGSAGRTELPVERYRIPLLVHAPGLVPARRVAGVASQMDVMPTLLGLLNFSYESRFFGRNLLAGEALPGRALLGNYQKLGYLRGDRLTILAPRQEVRTFQVNLTRDEARPVPSTEEEIATAIAYYQTAGQLIEGGGQKWDGS